MKAVEINKTGGPEVLEVKDISLDKPGSDQVTIEQKAIGLNYIDTYHRSGLYPLKLPVGLGLEGAGIITEIGKNVEDLMILTGDVSTSAGLDRFKKKFPEKYLDVGIAEQNLIIIYLLLTIHLFI